MSNDIICRTCGSIHYFEKPHHIHGAGIWCAECGRLIKWKGKSDKKKRRNSKHRKKWREMGPLVCQWCGISEDETKMGFEIDHITPIEDGGKDTFENTRPLCSSCHYMRNAVRHRYKYEIKRGGLL